MADDELKQLLSENKALMQKILVEMERQRRMRRWSMIITLVLVVLPLIIAAAALPWMIKTIESYYGGALTL